MPKWPACAPVVIREDGSLSKELAVPYFVQPTGITCQSTCLKMMGAFLEQQEAGDSDSVRIICKLPIQGIWEDLNAPRGEDQRPSKLRNAHINLKWWLEQRFRRIKFDYSTVSWPSIALERIVRFINGGLPVLVSVSHSRVEGHIVLVVGYQDYFPASADPSSAKLVVHDPYGRFDPLLADSPASTSFPANAWGNQPGGGRFCRGYSLAAGGEIGPGMNCLLPVTALCRRRASDAHYGCYYLLSGVPT